MVDTRMKNISSISLLYMYSNTPPLAYGSPAPKVAESIIRSREYNHLPNGGRNKDDPLLDRQFWLPSDGNFPLDLTQPTSNVNLKAMEIFAIEFLQKKSLQNR